MKSKWIINPILDLTFMLIGIIIFFIIKNVDSLNSIFTLITITIAVVVLDGGHVYLTYLRIYKEIKYIKNITIFLHVFVFIFFYIYQYLQLPYLWHFVVYATLFHFSKQFFGIARWYMFIDNNKRRILDIFFYCILYLPLLALHFRTDLNPIGYYNSSDTFLFPNQTIYNTIFYLHILALSSWFLYEISLFIKKEQNTIRFIYFLTTAILFSLVSYYAQNANQIILPIVTAHGLQYYFLNSKILHIMHFKNIKFIIIITLIVGVLFGYLNDLAEESLDLSNTYIYYFDNINTMLVSLLLTPLFVHYLLDMVIWKKKYFDRIKL